MSQSAADEVLAVFGSLLPSKMAEEPASKKQKGAQTGSSSKDPQVGGSKAKPGDKERHKRPPATMESLTLNLARTAIRVEDHINRQRMDTEFMLCSSRRTPHCFLLFQRSRRSGSC